MATFRRDGGALAPPPRCASVCSAPWPVAVSAAAAPDPDLADSAPCARARPGADLKPCMAYGTNYFILIILIGMSFLQKPVAILTAFASGLSVAFFSDSFAVTSTYKVITIVRKISPDLAAKMRPYRK
ncbi:hypothetical protein ZWY2020_030960 [Hordeum vulgare]|nr:hypothetical protein ZWY2020_030960 [Hordeum vulgare]